MRHFLFVAFFFLSFSGWAQHTISGRIINAENGEPLPYAKISAENYSTVLTNIDGSFQLKIEENQVEATISYVGFSSRKVMLTTGTEFVIIQLNPSRESLEEVILTSEENAANNIIERAIARRDQNDPEKVLNSFKFKSYNKFLIDNELNQISLETDSTNLEVETIINTGAAYLSEKVSEFQFEKGQDLKETILGIKNAGFKDPVYEVLTLSANPFSFYKKDYNIFETEYAGPLSKQAFKNYTYKLLDTTKTSQPAYVVYFKPKREKAVAGLEGILYLDTTSFAIQEAKAQLLGAIKLETEHKYEYFEAQELWFPTRQITKIRPGVGGKDISVFGGVISVGRLQQSGDIISTVLGGGAADPNLFLTSSTTHYDFEFNTEEKIKDPSAEIEVRPNAFSQSSNFWEENRQEDYSSNDLATEERVKELVDSQNVERRISIKNTIATGYYPIGFWDFDLGKFFKLNNYEGIRLGLGGKTNNGFSEKFNINGYAVYGTKDEVFKYGVGTSIFLHKPSNTNLNFLYTSDIIEVGSFDYLQGVNEFSILEPRFVNINFFYTDKTFRTGLTHSFTSKLNTEVQVSRSQIFQIGNYAYLHEGQEYSDYTLSQVSASFLWRPFSTFMKTGSRNVLTEKKFPQFTGQINRSFSGFLDGDFNFTTAGLKIEHEIKRLNQSRTEFILEGNLAFGDFPLTHAFHAFPNNANKPEILNRFAVAGHTSFETMYFNEFFSDKQAMLHVKHQFRPVIINRFMKPELVLVSRHAIGDFNNPEKHANINFGSLKHGYSEAGIEINNILAGFGLASAYRYGAYSLPSFNQNFALKFTFQLEL